MALIRFTEKPNFRNPWAEFERIRQGLDDLSRNFGVQSGLQDRASVFPPVNMYEDADSIVIKAELPGVATENMDISIEGDTLSLQGKRPAVTDDQEKVSYHRHEIEAGNFSRAIALPVKVDVDNITAKTINGILMITLPKAAEVKPRQIQVSVG